ncbi:MAG: RNA polymerase sigma factor FliA [Thiobacillaceae bacterium]
MDRACESREESQLLLQYAPLVNRIARHIKDGLPSDVEEDDLIQAGMIGLLDAIRRHDQTRDAPFDGYAAQRVRGSIYDELRRTDWMPRGVRHAAHHIEEAIGALRHRLGRPPTEGEAADALHMPLHDYQTLLFDFMDPQLNSLEQSGYKEEERSSFLNFNCFVSTSGPLKMLLDAELKECLDEALHLLPEREQRLMSEYYEEDHKLKEIGKTFGLSVSRLSQLHRHVVEELQTALRRKSWIPPA